MNTSPSHLPQPILPLSASQDVLLVGGKALNLARLITAGFPVPGGFVITTAAYQNSRAANSSDTIPPDLASAIADAYRDLGGPPVAVRSSATAEDMAGASMAGQYETILDVRSTEALLDAVRRCWSSLESPRVRSYLHEHQIDPAQVSMAVVVQELIPADVAGVLFTDNPQPGSLNEMLIEASWGLGEAVVSGIVQPDTLILDQGSGEVKKAVIADKAVQFLPSTADSSPVPESKRRLACMNSRDVHELWKLGWSVRRHFGSPQDIEWAIAGGRVFLLQSRAITTIPHADLVPLLLDAEKGTLNGALAEGRGPWVRHNLSETLPQPTPLTWSVMRRFMSGGGGFGAMYRMAGFQPSPVVENEGFLDLIAGRIYMDLSRGAEMFFAGFPFAFDVGLLKTHPDAAQNPPTIPRGTFLEKIRSGRRIAAVNRTLGKLSDEFVPHLTKAVIPEFAAWVQAERAKDLTTLSTAGWLDLWKAREHRIMDDFAPHSLLPSLLCGRALGQLREFVVLHFHDEDPDALVNLLSGAAEADLTVNATTALHAIAHGEGSREQWLEEHGHRAPEEFDLATARWHERPAALEALIRPLHGGPSPGDLHHKREQAAQKRIEELSMLLGAGDLAAFKECLGSVHRHLPWRENGKYHLMLGYQLLRDLALEAGRRLALESANDVFLLSLPELTNALETGYAPLETISARASERAALASIYLPTVVDAAALPRLGMAPTPGSGSRPNAFSISPGTATGPVRIVFKPEDFVPTAPGYVLVCPSTDPSWTPLFVQASAVIMERGGTLSHGAVVAREIGIPAVVVEDATRLYTDGEILTVDGSLGEVRKDGELAEIQTGTAGPLDTRIAPQELPPPPSSKDRLANRLRNFALIGWGVFLALFFLLPSPWLKDPCFGLLDTFFLPVVAVIGRPAFVALLAVSLGFFSMIGQRLLTDNARLTLAKKRAASLQRAARSLPPDSPRRRTLLAVAAPVQTRVALAAFVPLFLILGPMVLTFLWLPERIDPASWNPTPGTTAHVIARIAGDQTGPITLQVVEPLVLEEATPATRFLPPIRTTLEHQLARWRKSERPSADLSWDVREAARIARVNAIASLEAFLEQPIPAQTLTWTVKTAPGQPGRFPVAVKAMGSTSLTTHLVVGNRHGPEPKEFSPEDNQPVQVVLARDPTQPVRTLKVIYSENKTKGQDLFWKPADDLHARLGSPGWLAPWLMVYLLAYIPAMFLAKLLFRVP